MRLHAEKSVFHRRIPVLLQFLQSQETARRFAHLAARRIQMQNMEPVLAPVMPQIRFALRDLVRMVRKHVVNAAAMNIHILA